MKCPMCNGSGKCYEQKIRYQEIETNRTDFTIAQCHKCNGTGEVQMTNEERLRSTDTRGLAKELALLVLYDMPLYDRLHNVFEGGESAVIDECEKWLKEEHQ